MEQALAPDPSYAIDSRVKPPGIAMMVASGMFAALSLLGGFVYLAIFGFAAVAPKSASAQSDDTVALIIMITLVLVAVGLMIVIYGLIMFGGWSLMRRERYAFALTGVILCFVAGIPCSCFPINTLVFMPIGIWSLIVLLDAPVKESFQA